MPASVIIDANSIIPDDWIVPGYYLCSVIPNPFPHVFLSHPLPICPLSLYSLSGQELQHEPVILLGVFKVRSVSAGIENVELGVGDSIPGYLGVSHGYNAVLLAPDNQDGLVNCTKVVCNRTYGLWALAEEVHTGTSAHREVRKAGSKALPSRRLSEQGRVPLVSGARLSPSGLAGSGVHR